MSAGFDSLTVKHHLIQVALERYEEFGQETVLLHLGDHDPSGVSFYESMAEDLAAFCELIEVRRVALTPEQIAALGIATTPDEVKPTGSRSRAFIERGLEPTAQLEAIPPDTLTEVVRQAVEIAFDLDVLTTSHEQERRQVQAMLDQINEVLREAFGLRH